MSVDFKENGPHRFWIRRHGIGFGEKYHVVDRQTGEVERCTSFLHTALADCCIRNGVQYTTAPETPE